jgi:hypothetical protein
MELQRKLHEPWIANVQHLAERGTDIGDVAINGVELRVVPDVKDIRTKFHLESLTELGRFRETHVPVVDSRATAD